MEELNNQIPIIFFIMQHSLVAFFDTMEGLDLMILRRILPMFLTETGGWTRHPAGRLPKLSDSIDSKNANNKCYPILTSNHQFAPSSFLTLIPRKQNHTKIGIQLKEGWILCWKCNHKHKEHSEKQIIVHWETYQITGRYAEINNPMFHS